jgi:hypothetical protein
MENSTKTWLSATFHPVFLEPPERVIRLLEEALELYQSEGASRAKAHALIDYVFDRPVGDPFQELGGVMICAAGYAAVKGFALFEAWITEQERIVDPEMILKIRAKHAAKPVTSLTPEPFFFTPEGVQYRHAVRGTDYITLGEAQVQARKPIKEGETVKVYASTTEPYGMYVRRLSEFSDGRFQPLAQDLDQEVQAV